MTIMAWPNTDDDLCSTSFDDKIGPINDVRVYCIVYGCLVHLWNCTLAAAVFQKTERSSFTTYVQ